MVKFDFPHLCPKCQGYKTMPYTWNSTNQPRMCTCISPTYLGWECIRCGKINAPWKSSCDCTPFPLSSSPTRGGQVDKFLVDEIGQWEHPYKAGANPYNAYFPDTKKDGLEDPFAPKSPNI